MVTVSTSTLVDVLHLESTSDLPAGYDADVTAAETLVENQLEPAAGTSTTEKDALVWTATFIAAAFIVGTAAHSGSGPIAVLDRETATVRYNLDSLSDEALSYWARAEALDPTGELLSARTGTVFFKSFGSQ